MNTYYITDENYKNTDDYIKYMEENPTYGMLKIRAYAAREALPMENVKIIVKKIIGNNLVVFFEGLTDSSGMIDGIRLPTPKILDDNLISPKKASYTIVAIYDNMESEYSINMFEGICVVQNINVVPDMTVSAGGF